MAVTRCREIGRDRDGEKTATFQITYTRLFRVETNDTTDEASVVLAAHGLGGFPELPELYDEYPTDSAALCNSISAREESEDFKSWIVTCKYSNRPPVDITTNPLLVPPHYSLGFDQFTEVARQGIDVFQGTNAVRPITNTVGQTFRDPPVEADHCRAVYVVKRNEAVIVPLFVMDMTNSVNIAPWKGCPARTVKCKAITSGDIQQQNGLNYYTVTYEFHLDERTWDLRPLNRSTWINDDLGNLGSLMPGEEPQTIYTGQGGTTNGDPVPRSAVITDINQVYCRYRYFKERDFSVFPF